MIARLLQYGLRLFTLVYFLFLNWQLFTPVTVVQPGNWDKLLHFAAFFALASMLNMAGLKFNQRQWWWGLLAYAAFTEILQYFIPGRSFSVMDWLADALGIALGILMSRFLQSRWQWRGQDRRQGRDEQEASFE